MRVAFVPAARGELGEGGDNRMDRIQGAIRVGDVALDALNGEAAGQRAATADAHGVAESLLARRLADHAVVDALPAFAQGVDDPARAVHRGAFLVARDDEADRARILRPRSDEFERRGRHRGHAALHVCRAAAEKQSVADRGLERI